MLGIDNKVRLLGIKFLDSRIVEKILVTVPKRYEASITTLESTKDLSQISFSELLHALQAQDQRRLMRQEHVIEGVLPAKHQEGRKYKKNDKRVLHANSVRNHNQSKGGRNKKSYLPCEYCEKKLAIYRGDVGKDHMQNVKNAIN